MGETMAHPAPMISPGPSPGGMTVRWLGSGQREEAAEAWTAVDDARTGPRLCSSWPWTAVWLRHFGELVPHGFALVEEDGEPAGIVLVTVDAAGTAHLGTAGEPGDGIYVEDNRLPAVAGGAAGVAAALAAALRRQRLSLDGFAPEDAELLLARLRVRTVERQESPRVDLEDLRAAGHGGDIVAALAKGPRQRVRRSLRAFGELSCEWAADVPTALEILDELVALHQRRWLAAGQPGAFADPRVVAFHRELVAALLPRGEVLLFRVRDPVGGTVGCLYSYLDANRVLFYQGGFAQYADNKRRPGLTAHVLCLQACSDRGLAVYDLLAGASRYKQELATSTGELVWATAGPLGLRDGRRMLKRLVRGPRAA